MRRRLFGSQNILDRGEAARRLHSVWLTRHLHAVPPPPRIPVRPERTGGFSRLAARPHGLRRAARWWALAFERTEI